MIANSQDRWGGFAKAFHWSIVLLVMVAAPAGFLMSYTFGLTLKDKAVLPLHYFAGQIHHTVGFLILALALGRLGWRLWGGRRPEPEGGRDVAAGLVHAALYGLLFLLPLSGWAALSVYGLAPTWFLNQAHLIPPILPRQPLNSPTGYGFFAHIHIWGLWAGAGLVTLHVLAALWRHWVVKDDTLRRMWPLAASKQNRG
jgi:cytochrome b561